MNRLWDSRGLNFSYASFCLSAAGLVLLSAVTNAAEAQTQETQVITTPESIQANQQNFQPSQVNNSNQLSSDSSSSGGLNFPVPDSSSGLKLQPPAQDDRQTIDRLEFRGYTSQNPELPGVPDRSEADVKASTLVLTPLQKPPTRLFNLETANLLSSGEFNTSIGAIFFLKDQIGQGTGLQVFNGSIDAGISDNLQLGIAASFFDDDLGRTINGFRYKFRYAAIAPNIKYQFFQNESLSLSAASSIEFLDFKNGPDPFYYGTQPTIDAKSIVGTIQLPLTYSTTNRELQLHLTPGIAFFPTSLSNLPFYGTIFNLGAGVSWQAMSRLSLFADVNLPVGGTNAVSSKDGSLFKKLVFSAGLRYLVNPAVGLDVYATNALGATPATRFLAFLPDGDQVAIAATLNYAFGKGSSYASSFRDGTRVQLSKRDTQLLLDGITLTTADTLPPNTFLVRAGGLKSELGFNLAYGLANDTQLEIFGERLSNIPNRSNTFRFGGAAKLRFLDQVQGDFASVSVRGAFALDTSGDRGAGGFFTIEVPATYRPTPEVALFVNPKIGFLGSATSLPILNRTIAGIGLGINYELFGGLQLIGEVTPVLTGERSLWSAGIRYFNPDLNLGADLYGSNSVGNYTARGVVSDTNGSTGIGFNLHWLFGVK